MKRGILAGAVALLVSSSLGGGGSSTPAAETTSPTPDGEDAGDGGGGPGPDGGPADGGADGPTLPSVPDSIEVIVEPTDKAQALLSAVQGAKSSIHMTMYLLSDKRFISALVAQRAAGRDVKVVLNQTFPGGAGTNQNAFNDLKAGGVSVVWAPSSFTLTHEKCVMIDGAQAWIMTMNLATTSPENREYLALDRDAADVAEAEAMFAADFANTPFIPNGSLLVAPVNARTKLLTLIQSATKSVDLEGEELSDTKIVSALIAAKKAGAAVRVVLADNSPTPAQTSSVNQLKAAGIPVVSVGTPYIHAKAIVVDGAGAYVGSENFTTASLQYNRELGIITTKAASVSAVGTAIRQDFAAGSPL